jgi:very-short-patch-repair endonuclease
LVAALGTHPPSLTRSEAERRLLSLIRDAGLPAPRTNVRIGPYEVDMLWPAARLIVEVDGYAYHASRAAFERDRARDAELQARGYRVIRITWRQIEATAHAVVARLAAALAIAA